MSMPSLVRASVLVLLMLAVSNHAMAQDAGGGGEGDDSSEGLGDGCPDPEVFTSGKFLKDLCWSCMMPIRIAGASSGKASKLPGDTANGVCVCPSASLMGMPTPGVTYGMWKPTHFVESVRTPGCFPAIGQKTDMGSLAQAGQGRTSDDYGSERAFRSTHLYQFPVGAVLDMATSSACSDSSYDLDLLMMTEIDPTYNNDQLSAVINPESHLFNNQIAIAACMVDAAAASAFRPIREMFWCFGAWGNTYQLTGFSEGQSAVVDASVSSARLIAIQHKRFLMNRTYGNSAVCAAHPEPMYPKQQYRWQVMHPVPQKNDNDWTGSSTLLSREWRHRPITGEDWVQVLFRYEECCVQIP